MVSGTATTPIVAGQLCWHEVATREPDKIVDFYTALLGWRPPKRPTWTARHTPSSNRVTTWSRACMMSIAGDVIERRQDQWI